MKKILFLISSIVLIGILFTNCSDDFLETRPSNAIGSAELPKDPNALRGLLKGTYKYMQAFGTGAYTGATGQHDDSGIISFMILQDVLALDIIAGPGGWYTFTYQHYPSQRYSNHRRATFWWNTSYGIIKNCNAMIQAAEGNTDPEFLNITAQAKTLRAFAYHNLVRQYRKTYRLGHDGPGVPLVLEPPVGDPEIDSKPAGKLSDVFKQITDDLNWAIENFGSIQRPTKGMVNKNVAEGLLARVLLEMAYAPSESAKFDQVITLAKSARTGFPLMSAADYGGGFNTIDNVEWLWGHKQDAEGNISWPGFYSFYDIEKSGRFGYQNFLADTVFVNMFDENDGRKLFEWNDLGNGYDKYAIEKFVDKPDRTGDLPYLRAAELLLIEAEAEVNKGNYNNAQKLLDELRAKRITGYQPEVALNNKNDMLERIWIERRKELYGEGFALYDIMRFGFFLGGTTKVQRGPYHLDFDNELRDIPADNDKRYLREIPDLEFDSNKAMDRTKDQNER